MERRDFLKAGCTFMLAAGTGVALSTFSACAPGKIYKTVLIENKIVVPLANFEKSNLQVIRIDGFEYDIALRKIADNNFAAFLMRCTHADNQLFSTGNGFTCNLHGSVFDESGLVKKGPASEALKKYTTEVNGDSIFIYIN